MDQLTLIFDVVGSPQPHEVAHIRNSQAKRFLESMQDRVKVRKLRANAYDRVFGLSRAFLAHGQVWWVCRVGGGVESGLPACDGMARSV